MAMVVCVKCCAMLINQFINVKANNRILHKRCIGLVNLEFYESINEVTALGTLTNIQLTCTQIRSLWFEL
jgi:hypothetical protein